MKRNRMIKLTSCLAAVGLAACLVQTASAQSAGQTNFNWLATGDAATWSQGANWELGFPPPADGTVYQINLGDFSANSPVPIEVAPTDVVAIVDSTFGPMWGQTLDIYGSYSCGFGMFVWGALNGPVTTLNVHTNAVLSCGDTLAVGTAWWFPGGPNVVMNVYSNAFVGVNWLQFGSRMNLYGGTVSVTNGLGTGTATGPVFAGGLDTDLTRAINLTAGSMLILPVSYTSTVNDWISRGVLQVYGVPGDTAEIVIDEASTNYPGRTVVTTTATGASALQAIRIQAPRSHLYVGGLEQAEVYADYSIATNVNVTSSLSSSITYQSMATNVVTITAAGQVRAVGPGTATLWAMIGAFSNSVSVTVDTYTNKASLIHRYSFSEASGTTAADSVGGSDWDGNLFGGASFTGDGHLVLDGVSGIVQLPAGILTNMDAVTIEAWASFGTISNWACLWAFGDTDGTFGHNYVTCQPHTGTTRAQTGIKNASTEQNPSFTPTLDNFTNVQIVGVYHPEAGYCSIYTNGVLAAINSSITITLPDAMSTGDPFNLIGQSLYSADPFLAVTLDEFRIYQGPMSVGQIQADAALGPNQLIGTSTSVSLTAMLVGNSIVITWPTTSRLVDLVSSPALGTAAVWTPVSTSLGIVGGNYQATVPMTGTAQFFQLR